jgi:hypothetical protein
LARFASGTDGLYYFVMEFVDGGNLRQLLSARRIEPSEAVTIVGVVQSKEGLRDCAGGPFRSVGSGICGGADVAGDVSALMSLDVNATPARWPPRR